MLNILSARQQQPCVFAVLLLLACIYSPQLQSQARTPGAILALENATVIVGDGSVIEDATILVEGGLISAVGRSGQLELPNGTRRIDLSGKTVIPALIDAHTHLGYEGHGSWGSQNYSRENLIDHLQRYAYYGFGAVFSAGSDPDQLAIALQQEQREGVFVGARFLFAAGMAPPGQGPNDQFLAHTMAVSEATGMTMLYGIANTQQARAAVQAVANKKIPFIKVWVDDRGGSQLKLEPQLYRAIIEEAKKNQIQVFVHQQTAGDMPDLLVAGTDGFLHGRLSRELDDAIARQIGQAGAFVVPNLGLGELRRETIGNDTFLQQTIPPAVVARLSTESAQRQLTITRDRRVEAELRQGLSRLLNAGVDILLGTDAGAIPDHFFGYSGHRELEIFVRLGMTPMQALVSATSKPAQRLGLDDMGLIRQGYSADLVILNENPLVDIRNTRSISQVYLRGKEVDREMLLLNMRRRF